MDDEMDALVKNDTWDLVRLPSGKKAIDSKWVYKVKCKSDGSVERYKARLVAKGCAQTKGLDYDETFSPVAKMTTVRLVIAMASMFGWKLRQMDVNNAFLNGDLEEEVYMIQPEGYQHPEFPYYVCRLKKALYGLKQAPRAWCEKITRFLKKIGFKQSTVDHSLFLKHVDGEIVVIVLYVDDLILTGSHDEHILDVKRSLLRQFNMKDLGELRYFLGIEIVGTLSEIWMIQRQYALDMLEKYGMTACKPVDTPLDQNVKLVDDGHYIEDVTMYRKMVGSLIYLTITRPDLSYAVSVVSQFMQKPCKSHLDAVRWIMRYVKSTVNYGMFYEKNAKLYLYGYTDADWAGDFMDKSL
ncbi:hypothetical protein L7F22_032815 [Adiantum nelumboides]|nr:hypothetical protein [Adiantum nelumboides]